MSLRNQDGDGNEYSKKEIDLDKQNNNFVVTLFYTFLCRRCTTTTWNCLISRFVEDGNKKTKTFFFFSSTLMQSFRIQLQKNLPTFDELNEME